MGGDSCRADCTLEICGDRILDAGEDCDDGNTENGDCCSFECLFEDGLPCSDEPDATCRVNCLPRRCGDSVVDPGFGEECEWDAHCGENNLCLACVCEIVSICGNAIIDFDEGCDDSNTDGGDGCSGFCQVEDGWECSGQPSVCRLLCGNGILNEGEECDEGEDNSNEPDAPCRTDCTLPGCGDRIIDPGAR